MKDGTLDVSESDFEWFCKNMYQTQASVHPPLPKSLAELHSSLSNYDHLTTNKGEHFVLVEDVHQIIAIHSLPNNLQYLSQTSIILVDGTFYPAPHQFSRLFAIHGFCCSQYIPLYSAFSL